MNAFIRGLYADLRQSWRWTLFEFACLCSIAWMLDHLWAARTWGLAGQILTLAVVMWGWPGLQAAHRWWCDPREQAVRHEMEQERQAERQAWARRWHLHRVQRRPHLWRSAK